MVRILMLSIFLGLSAASTADSDTRKIYTQVAQYSGVPEHLLYAMAQAESGRLVEGEFIPWPWTLNIEGEANYYPSRRIMFRALMSALQAGKLKVDVGPMQVNWYWQYQPDMSPWRLTEPGASVKIAADILKSHHRSHGSWIRAVGQYHRPREATKRDRDIALAYRNRVQRLLESKPREVGDVDG